MKVTIYLSDRLFHERRAVAGALAHTRAKAFRSVIIVRANQTFD